MGVLDPAQTEDDTGRPLGTATCDRWYVPPRRRSLVERFESSDAFLRLVGDEVRMGRVEYDGHGVT